MLNKKNGLSVYRQKKIMWAFAVDLTATQAALSVGSDRKTVNRYYGFYRSTIHAHQSEQIADLVGVNEYDESYFNPERLRGIAVPPQRGCESHMQSVFGIFERNGRVFTEIVPDVKAKIFQSMIRGKISSSNITMTAGWRGYDGLVDVGYDKLLRIKKYHIEGSPLTHGNVHVHGLERFWSYTQKRLARFNGVKVNFDVHLKECEWRWGKSPEKIFADLLKLLV